jgi:hypothetical protein
LLVPGGTFSRSYDGVDFTDKSYPATVDDFYLDKYEITVYLEGMPEEAMELAGDFHLR